MTRGTLGIIVTVVLVPLLLAEFTECGRWLAERLVRRAARRLGDPEAVERAEEEWVANLQRVPGKLFIPLGHAVLVSVLAVPQMRATPAAEGKRSRVLAYGLGVVLAYGLLSGLGVVLAYGLLSVLSGGLAGGLVGRLGVGLSGRLSGGLVS